MSKTKPLNQNKMGDMEFNGTPEEWDALVKKNKEQETLEEAAENHLQKWRQLNNIHLSNVLHAERCKNDFIAGAKWQQEQMEKLKDFEVWKEWKK